MAAVIDENNLFQQNLDLVLKNPAQSLEKLIQTNFLQHFIEIFSSYLNNNEITSDNFKKLMAFSSHFLTAYCPRLENLNAADPTLQSYFGFLASLRNTTHNINEHALDSVYPSLHDRNLTDFINSCRQLNETSSIHHLSPSLNNYYFSPTFADNVKKAAALNAAAGAFEVLSFMLTHIMQRYQFSNPAIKVTRIILGLISSLGISVLPFVYSLLTLTEQENQALSQEKILLTALCAYSTTFSFHIIKNIALQSERVKYYLNHCSPLKLLANNLPLFGCLFIVANGNENRLEGLSIAMLSYLAALIPNLATQYAVGFFPNKIEKTNKQENINLKEFDVVISTTTQDNNSPNLSDNHNPAQPTSAHTPSNPQTIVDLSSITAATNGLANNSVNTQYVPWGDTLSAPAASTLVNPSIKPSENELTEKKASNQLNAYIQTDTTINLNAPITKLFTPKFPINTRLVTLIKGTVPIQPAPTP